MPLGGPAPGSRPSCPVLWTETGQVTPRSREATEPSRSVEPHWRRRGTMADQIAFMVMPFGRKKVGSERSDAPKEVDFDALWRNVHTPVLKGLGFRPIRADADLGALIVNEMVQ